MDLRCENGIKFGTVFGSVLEVKCRSKRCGHEAGTVVLHRFSLKTGEPLETRRFKDPARKEGATRGASRDSALRSA